MTTISLNDIISENGRVNYRGRGVGSSLFIHVFPNDSPLILNAKNFKRICETPSSREEELAHFENKSSNFVRLTETSKLLFKNKFSIY